MDFKRFLKKLRLFFVLENNIKKEIVKLGFGKPVEVLKRNKHNYYLCPKDSPPEYCSFSCSRYETLYLTDRNEQVKVTEIFEDEYSLKIEAIL